MNRVRIQGSILAAMTSGEGVERGTDGVPVAFRIWKAGPNVTDHGVHTFSEESARALLEEQAARGNLYSIDVDHLSLSPDAPPEARKAVGWHRLDVRGGDLWAVDVEWTDTVRGGLAKTPPEWRYFSPAYDVAKKTGEIVSYANTALTNNPATWSVTALATATATAHREAHMDCKAIAAALMGDDDDKKKEARSAIAAMNDLEKKAWKAYKKAAFDDGDGDEPKKDEPGEGATAAAKATEEDPEKKKEEEAKRAAAGKELPSVNASVAAKKNEAELLATIGTQETRLAALETKEKKDAIEAILAKRPDLTAKQLEHLRGKSEPKDVQELVDLIEAPKADPAAAARVQGTRGSHDGTTEVRAARLPPAEHRELANRFGRQTEEPKIRWGNGADDGGRNDRIFPLISKAEALRVLAKHGAAPPLGRVPVTATIEQGRRQDAARNGADQ